MIKIKNVYKHINYLIVVNYLNCEKIEKIEIIK